MYGQISKLPGAECTGEEGGCAAREPLPAVRRDGKAPAGPERGGIAGASRALTASFTHLEGNANVVQRKPFTKEDIKGMAKKRGCPEGAVTGEVVEALLEMVNPIEESYSTYTSIWNVFGKSEPHNIINSALDMIKAQHDAGVTEPGAVINSVLAMMQGQIGKGDGKNIKGARDVAGMFSDTELFDISRGEEQSTSLAEIMKALDEGQRTAVLGCMSQLQACCTVKGVGRVVEGALVNVNKSLLDPGYQTGDGKNSKVYTEAFVERMRKMTAFVKGAYEDIESRHRGRYEIEPTGSDPHKGGKHALFLVDKETGEKRVYKPREMAVDNALTGKSGMLDLINGTEKNPDLTLPVMEINPGDKTEEFVNKKGSFTEKEAEKYYFKMGMLECAGSVIGAADLHQDNIMPTAGGPVIIDAECAFADFGGTGLGDALEKDAVPIGLRDPVAVFNIQSGKNIQKSTNAYNQGDQKNKYSTQYKEGFNFMLQRLKDRFKEKDFSNSVGGVLAGVDRVRIVPVSTSIFAGSMHTYIGADTNIRESIIKDLCENILANLRKDKYVFNTGDKDGGMEINQEALKGVITAAFNARTIPALELDISNGILYMDDVAIGKSPVGGGMKEVIKDRMVKKLESMSPEKL